MSKFILVILAILILAFPGDAVACRRRPARRAGLMCHCSRPQCPSPRDTATTDQTWEDLASEMTEGFKEVEQVLGTYGRKIPALRPIAQEFRELESRLRRWACSRSTACALSRKAVFAVGICGPARSLPRKPIEWRTGLVVSSPIDGPGGSHTSAQSGN